MVLVSYILGNYVSLLQTKLSHREGHEARRIGLEAMPLDQHIKSRHGEREAGLEVLPDPVRDFLKVADHGQHGEHRLDEHPVLPFAALTQFQVAGIPLRGVESGITQDNHAFFELANQPLKRVIRDIGGGTRPPHHQAVLVQQQAEFATDNPPVIREAFAADLLGTAAFAHGVDELDPVRVDDAEHRRSSQEGLRPVLMGPEEAKEPGALGELGKQRPIVARQPAIERPVAPAFEGMQQSQGDHLTGPEVGLGVFGDSAYLLIDLVEQRRDKIHCGHAALLSGEGCHADQRGGVV